MSTLFTELKRRNIFKVAIAYLVVGWLVVQVVASISPMLELPEVFGKMVLVALLAGLPIALLFAWAYELTPEGIKKSKDVEVDASISHHTSRKIDFIIIGALVLIIGGLVFDRINNDVGMSEEATLTSQPSIAVLPFKDMSEKSDQAYMGEGIADELLNTLAQEEGLDVTARTSSFVFADGKTSITEIGEKLNVGHVLEGSVRRSDTRIRITAQLIDTKSGNHLWSKTYTRELKDIFALEDEIVGEIHASLLQELLGKRKATTTKTISPEAYDLYLQGLQDFRIKDFASIERAVEAFEKSLSVEPDFSLAKLKLADALRWRIATGSHSDPTMLDRAEGLVREVLGLDPESGDAHYVLSQIYGAKDDYEAASRHLKRAYQLAPNNADVISTYAWRISEGLGEKQARENYQRALRLDPLNSDLYLPYGYFLGSHGEYEEAEKVLKRAISLNPTNPNPPYYFGRFYGVIMGDLVQAIPQYEQAVRLDPADPDGPTELSNAYLSLGDGDKALHYAEQAYGLMPKAGTVALARVNALMLLGRFDAALALALDTLEDADTFHRFSSENILVRQALALMIEKGALDEAEALFMKSYPSLGDLLKSNDLISTGLQFNQDAITLVYLASLYRSQGRSEEAAVLAARLVLYNEDWALGKNKILSGESARNLAFYSMGRLSDAKVIDYLEAAIDGGYLLYWRSNIAQSSVFLSLHQYPRYIALIKHTETEMARQLAIMNAREVGE